jgi:hypothetical protein
MAKAHEAGRDERGRRPRRSRGGPERRGSAWAATEWGIRLGGKE